jgi:hypothetical protein
VGYASYEFRADGEPAATGFSNRVSNRKGHATRLGNLIQLKMFEAMNTIGQVTNFTAKIGGSSTHGQII